MLRARRSLPLVTHECSKLLGPFWEQGGCRTWLPRCAGVRRYLHGRGAASTPPLGQITSSGAQRSRAGGGLWWLRPCSLYLRMMNTGPPVHKKGRSSYEHYLISQDIKVCANKGDLRGLRKLVRRQRREKGPSPLNFDPINCCNWLNKFVRMEQQLRGPPVAEVVLVLEQVEYLLRHEPARFTPREVANLANALGRLRYDWGSETPWVDMLLGQVAAWVGLRAEGLQDFNAIDLANLTNAFAKAGLYPGEELLSQIAEACVALQPSSFAPQALGNLVNGFARWGVHPGQPFLSMVTRECSLRSLSSFHPQDLANILNGFERLDAPLPPKLLHRVARECVDRGLQGFNSQDVANIVHVFAARGIHPGQGFIDTVTAHSLACGLEGLSAGNLAATAQAFATLRHPPGEALLDVLCKALLDVLCKAGAGQRPLPRPGAVHITRMLDAFARLQHHLGEGRQQQILELLEKGFASLDRPQLSTLLPAVAILRCNPDERWVAAFLSHCAHAGWDGFATPDLARILWASVVLQAPVHTGLAEELAARLWAAVEHGMDRDGEADTLPLTYTTVRHAHFLLDAGQGEGWQHLGDALEATAGQIQGGEQAPREAHLPKGLAAALKASYPGVETGVWVVEGLLWLDAVITLPCGTKVGVGVEGPADFFSNRQDLATGVTLFKWRLLDRAVELGLLQGWVAVRDGSAEDRAKVQEAVKAAQEGRP